MMTLHKAFMSSCTLCPCCFLMQGPYMVMHLCTMYVYVPATSQFTDYLPSCWHFLRCMHVSKRNQFKLKNNIIQGTSSQSGQTPFMAPADLLWLVAALGNYLCQSACQSAARCALDLPQPQHSSSFSHSAPVMHCQSHLLADPLAHNEAALPGSHKTSQKLNE